MSILFFDTETTGLPDMKRLVDDPMQPHICQLGAILTDDDGRVKAEINFIVKPDGWEIPLAASEIHGIGHDDAIKYGLSIKGVLSVFARLMSNAKTLVAHNLKFDFFMLQIECARSGIGFDFPTENFCTMARATDIVKIPPTERMLARDMKGYKSPSLKEAYRHFFNQDFEGAHDAMVDVRACMAVYFRIKQQGVAA